MKRKGMRRAMFMGVASLVLLASSLVAASCSHEEAGEKGPEPAGNQEIQVEVTDRSDVDSLLRDLDRAMDSVSPEDFSDAQLGDNELGL